MKILVVDDNNENIEMMMIILKNRNYKVASAGNGQEALDKLRFGKFDLIISDTLMPVMDGFQFCRECKKDNKLSRICFIFYTATYIDDKDEEFALALGAQKFIRKPQEPEVFLNLIQEVIKKSGNGKISPIKYEEQGEKEILKLYSERLVAKLEKQNLELENEIASHKITEIRLKESEEEYKTLFTDAHEAIFIADVESGIILDCNEAACTLVEMQKEELIGKHQSFLHPPDELVDEFTKSFQRHTTNEQGHVLNSRVLTKSGTIKDVEIKANVLTIREKKIIQGFFNDVTERKRAEEALLKEKHLFNSLVETTPDSIYFKDRESRFIRINNTMAKRFGLNDPQEVLGKTDFDFFDKEHARQAFKDEQRIIATGEPLIGIEEKEVWQDGRITWVSTTKMPLRDKTGIIIGIMGLSRDVTDRKQIEEILVQSEVDLKKAQEVAHIGSWKWHIQSGKVEWTDEMFRIFGINKKTSIVDLNEVVGKAVHPDDRSKVEESNNSVRFNKTPVPLEYRIVLPDSSVRIVWAEAGELQLDEKGRPMVLIGIVQDITERKQAEEALVQEQYLMYALMNNVPDNIYFKDRASRFIRISKAQAKLFGLNDPSEAEGKTDFDFFTEEHACQAYEDEQEIIRTGQPLSKEEKETWADRPDTWASTTKLPLHDNEGNIIGTFGISRDITRRKNDELLLKEKNQEIEAKNKELLQTNKELKLAKVRAEESDKLKTSFLANISHEVRTPMNGIMGFIELLKKPDLKSSDQKRFLEIIEKCSSQLLSIISNIVEISKVESRQISINKTPVNIRETLNTMYAAFSNNLSVDRNLSIKLNIPSSVEECVCITDETKLIQILTNLIDNAIKFTHEGTVEIGCQRYNSKELEFYVRDSGIGIPKKYHKSIFERFSQVQSTFTREYGGMGLGLSISKVYVELLGGRIWLDSKPGKGSTFHFTLPYTQVTKEDRSAEVSFKPVKDELSGKVILIAEDDNNNYAYLEEILLDKEVKVIRAKNGKEAVDLCMANPEINLVLMDIKMPVLDGYKATEQILKFRKKLPIVAQTAYAFLDDKQKAMDSGCVDYISKPINNEQLIAILVRHLKSQLV